MKYQANPVIVDAYEITEISAPNNKGSRLLRDLDLNIFEANAEMMSRMTPAIGDFWVVQSDGYVYLNPRDVFLRKYAPIDKGSSFVGIKEHPSGCHLDLATITNQDRTGMISEFIPVTEQMSREQICDAILKVYQTFNERQQPLKGRRLYCNPIVMDALKLILGDGKMALGCEVQGYSCSGFWMEVGDKSRLMTLQEVVEYAGTPVAAVPANESTCATGKHHFEKANCNTGKTVDGIPQYFSAIFCQRCGEVREIKQMVTAAELEIKTRQMVEENKIKAKMAEIDIAAHAAQAEAKQRIFGG